MFRFVPNWLLVCSLAFAGCQGAGERTFLGYSARPLHDEDIQTIYVPTFKNFHLQTTTNRELEVDITKAVIREIEQRTHMKVVSDRDRADTELVGSLVTVKKQVINMTLQFLARDVELTGTVSVVWRDLRAGKLLSNRRPGRTPETPTPFDPTLPPVEEDQKREKANPVLITATGRVLPELGESNATAYKAMTDQIAKQIVNMMEAGW